MSTEAALLDRTFHALADPSRRSIVAGSAMAPASVSELAAPLEMSLPAVVQHLEVLQKSGLVRSEKVGRVRTCRLEPAPMRVGRAVDRPASRVLGGAVRPPRRRPR